MMAPSNYFPPREATFPNWKRLEDWARKRDGRVSVNGMWQSIADVRRQDVERWGNGCRWLRRRWSGAAAIYDSLTGGWQRACVRHVGRARWQWVAYTALEDVACGEERSLRAAQAAAETALTAWKLAVLAGTDPRCAAAHKAGR
jgi:hypothetical protein